MKKPKLDDLKRSFDEAKCTYHFWSHIVQNPPPKCWEWRAGKNEKGYGQMRVGSKTKYAHRVSYEFHRGPIPKNARVMHECGNTGCVNPNHLVLRFKEKG